MKLRNVVDKSDSLIGYDHWCPGCKQRHFIPITRYREGGNPTWTFDGNMEFPTFNPSVRVFIPALEFDGESFPEETLCHYFLHGGILKYCGDSAHEYAGKEIPLTEERKADMANLGGLNLGGPDKNPATPPSGPAEGGASEATKTANEDSAKVAPTDKQKDADGVKEVPKTDSEIADAVAEVDAAPRESVAARWSSHPIARYTVGDYSFENGLLVLRTQEEADEFQAVYDELPIYEQTRIRKIDVTAAEAMVRERLAAGGTATKGIDSSTGDRAPNKQVGEGDLLAGGGE